MIFIITIMSSVVSASYYLKIIKIIMFDEPVVQITQDKYKVKYKTLINNNPALDIQSIERGE